MGDKGTNNQNLVKSKRNWKAQRHTVFQTLFIVFLMAGITSYYFHGAIILVWIPVFILILASRKVPIRKMAFTDNSIDVYWLSQKVSLSIPYSQIVYHELSMRYSIKDRMELLVLDIYTNSKSYSFTEYEFSNIKELHQELCKHVNPGPEPLFVTKTKNVWLAIWGIAAIIIGSGLFYISLTDSATNSFLGLFFLLFVVIGIGMVAAYGRIK